MDGTAVDFLVIPIVALISLAAWLVMIYVADSHPVKDRAPASAKTAEPGAALARKNVRPRAAVPQQRPRTPVSDRQPLVAGRAAAGKP